MCTCGSIAINVRDRGSEDAVTFFVSENDYHMGLAIKQVVKNVKALTVVDFKETNERYLQGWPVCAHPVSSRVDFACNFCKLMKQFFPMEEISTLIWGEFYADGIDGLRRFVFDWDALGPKVLTETNRHGVPHDVYPTIQCLQQGSFIIFSPRFCHCMPTCWQCKKDPDNGRTIQMMDLERHFQEKKRERISQVGVQRILKAQAFLQSMTVAFLIEFNRFGDELQKSDEYREFKRVKRN